MYIYREREIERCKGAKKKIEESIKSEYSNGILNLFYLFAGPKIVTDDEMILDVSGRFGKLTRRMAPT